MNRKFVVLFVLVMVLVLSLSVNAEDLTNSTTNTTLTKIKPLTSNVTIDPNAKKITLLQLKINSLEKQISELNTDLSTLENKINRGLKIIIVYSTYW